MSAEYKDFSEWFLKTFSQGILSSILKVLDAYRRGVYVSPRVMQQGEFCRMGPFISLCYKFFQERQRMIHSSGARLCYLLGNWLVAQFSYDHMFQSETAQVEKDKV